MAFSVSFFLLFICFFVPSFSSQNWPVEMEFPIKDSVAATGSFRVNLQQHAEIVISHQADIGVCFQRLYQVPAVDYYSDCTIYIPLTSPSPSPAPSHVPSSVPVYVPAPDHVPSPDHVPGPGHIPASVPDHVPSPDHVPTHYPIPTPIPVPIPASDHQPVPAPHNILVPAPIPTPAPAPTHAPTPIPAPDVALTVKTNVGGVAKKRSVISLQSLLRYGAGSSKVLDFTDEEINFGIYYLNSGEHEMETIKVSFSGQFCNTSQIFNGASCELPRSDLKNNQTDIVDISDLSIFYSIEVPARARYLTIIAEPTDPESNNVAEIYLRYMGTPSSETYDAHDRTRVTFDLPSKGTWYARVVLQESQTFKVTAMFMSCEGNGVGPLCNNTIDADPTKIDVRDLKANQWVYYKFISTPSNSLRVSVQPQSGKPPVRVYASTDQIPTINHSDIKGCNQPNCEAITIIYINSTTSSNTTWYIGLSSPNDTSYGIWFSSVCAPKCQENGRCTNSGVDTGLCVCGESYAGLDCTEEISNGLKPQYIVLIIIASLVVASVIIGLIAWIYMRRRQQGYAEVTD